MWAWIRARFGYKVEKVEHTLIYRAERDTLKPGAVVTHDGRSYRVTKLLIVNRLGAFYEAKSE